MKSLILDDSKTMRIILGRILKEMNITYDESPSANHALCWLAEGNRPELIMVDWNMPEMNGLEFVKIVRANPQYDGIVLIMVTTETEMDNVSLALEAGVNEYIMKPFTKEIVQEKLNLIGVI
ncbi:response regulator [Kamptonema cortianum]|nr:response regulator [Oscillatoria laete-virens]MDK3161846.1 response regulator [Kamptonema cortianum]MDL5054416.1 response regulator [Oscillatoria laete-virens NRMC-F 0139]